MRGAVNLRRLGPCVYNFPALIVTTVWASLVRLLHFVTIGALGKRWCNQKVVRAPLVLSRMRVSAFWIRHTNSFNSPRLDWGILWCFHLVFYCFLNQSCFRRARGAIRVSARWLSQRHSSLFKFTHRIEGRRPLSTITSTDRLHGQRQQDLLGQDIGQEHSLTLEERDFSVVEFEALLVFLCHGRQRILCRTGRIRELHPRSQVQGIAHS